MKLVFGLLLLALAANATDKDGFNLFKGEKISE